MGLIAAANQRLDQAFYGWKVLAASCVVNAAGAIYYYGFSIFFLPIKEALHLSSASTALVFSLSRAEGAISAPIAGYLIDRFGPRKILTVGIIIVGVGYLLLSQVDSFLWFLLVYVGIIAVAFDGSVFQSTLSAVNSWFVRRKGLAMAISISAYSLGGAIIAPLLALGVQHLGWRMTVALAGGIFMPAVVIPSAQVMRTSPESMGLRPDGDAPPPAGTASAAPRRVTTRSVDFTVKEALRTPAFWMLAVGTMLRTGVMGTVLVHFVPIMVWKGTSAQTAALMLGTIAFLSIPMRIGIGWTGDRWSVTQMLAAGMVMGALGLLILQEGSSQWHLWASICLLSVMESVGALNWSLLGQFYGRARFATIRGMLSLVYSWGGVLMPVLAGIIFDRTDSYANVIWTLMAGFLAAAVLFSLLRRPSPPARVGLRRPAESRAG